MMRASIVVAGLLAIGVMAIGVAAVLRAEPVGGPKFLQPFNIPAAHDGPFGEEERVMRFEGGRPARVILVGDHKPVADLEIFVFEVSEKGDGKLVAHDGGPEQGDRLGVVWYPPRTGNYRIVVRNPAPATKANPWCEASMSIR
jgi:hypothetical protein